MTPACFNQEAENALVGAVIERGSKVYMEAARKLPTSEAFYDVKNQALWRLFGDMMQEGLPIDASMVMTAGQRLNRLGECGGPGWIAEVTANPGMAEYHTDIVAECWLRRRVLAACSTGVEAMKTSGDTEKLVDQIVTSVFAAAKTTHRESECYVSELMSGVIDRIEQAMNGTTMTGIKSGLAGLDSIIGGFKPGQMIVIGARPSVGKTALGLQMAYHAAINDKVPVGFFSAEMDKESIAERLVSMVAKVPMNDILKGYLTEGDKLKIFSGIKDIMKTKIVVDDNADLSAHSFSRRAMEMVESKEVKLIVLDYIQLMSAGTKGGNRYQEVTEISKAVKRTAKNIGVPILVLAQLNRKTADEERDPRPSDLRESGQLEQDADVILLPHAVQDSDPGVAMKVHPDCQSDAGQPWELWGRRIDLIVGKHRNGPTGKARLFMHTKTMRFESL